MKIYQNSLKVAGKTTSIKKVIAQKIPPRNEVDSWYLEFEIEGHDKPLILVTMQNKTRAFKDLRKMIKLVHELCPHVKHVQVALTVKKGVLSG